MVTLLSESRATSGFFSPIRVNFPHVLVKRLDFMEIYEITSAVDLVKTIQYRETNVIYDYLWLPNSSLYLSLIKDHPISMRHRETGKLLQKYPVYNHLCEIKSPYAACIAGSSIFACIGNKIYEFDVEIPVSSSWIIKGSLRPRSVSNCIEANGKIIALGSYNTEVYLIDKDCRRNIAMLQGQEGGVIQCVMRGNYMYVGGRKDNHVLLWDLRNLGKEVGFVNKFSRVHPTNQKILFDVDQNGNLGVGNFDGSIVKYNCFGEVKMEFNAHFDAVNSVQFYEGGIVSSSGQRHYEEEEQTLEKSLIRVWGE